MNPPRDSTSADLQKVITDLRSELADARLALDERIAKLRSNEERYTLVSQAVAEGAYDWDIENNTLWVSARLIEIYGLTDASLRAEDWNAKIHPDDFAQYRAALRACFKRAPSRLHCEYRIRLTTGEYRWIEDSGVPVRDLNGRAVRLVGAVSDITERRKAAQALAETSRVKDGLLRDLNAVSESIDYGVLFMGPDLRTRVVNRAFREMWGMPDAFIAGGPTMAQLIEYNRFNGIYDVPDAEFDAYVASRVKAIRAGNIAPVEMHRADGMILRYEGIVLPDDGRLLTYFDITESKQREAELNRALERQTAAAEVLEIINASPDNLTPVFEAILEKALRLCDAAFGSLLRFDGNFFHRAATHNFPAVLAKRNVPIPPFPGSALRRLTLGEPFAHLEDITADDVFRSGNQGRLAMAEAGARTTIWVALRKGDVLLGTVVAYRREVSPFSGKQIALLQNFAQQAVIAIENARLLTETREALEQQTATAEVLEVINASAGDLGPVFDAMLEKATRLCLATYGQLAIYDGEVFRFVAAHGEAYFALGLRRDPHPPSHGVTWLRILAGENIVHIPDVKDTDLYRAGHQQTREFVDNGRGRSLLSVALRKDDDTLLGVLSVYRQEPRPFTDKQIAVLQNFAVQAVIAMENARLIAETREALAQQTATAEVLGVINASPGDLTPVFNAMVERAAELCEADEAAVRTFDGEVLHLAATHGPPGIFEQLMRLGPSHPDGLYAGIASGDSVTHFFDVHDTEAFRANERARERLILRGIRSWLAVALRKEGTLLGVINVHRRKVRPFSAKQVALLQNFAAQAVIAMENARLITETREALEQQTATAEVLQVINSSPGNLAPVFDVMLEKALNLCGAALGYMLSYDGERFHRAASRGFSAALEAALPPPGPTPGSLAERFVLGEKIICVTNLSEEDPYRVGAPAARALVDVGGVRSYAAVALRNGNRLLGVIAIYRQEVRPFTDKQIALLQNFAAQAVIAMENARLITETREALEQQTATAEVLQVINASPADLAPVFDAMLGKAVRLCEFPFAALWTYDRGRFSPVAFHAMPTAFEAYLRDHSPPAFERLHDAAGPIHIADVMATELAQRDPAFTRVAREVGRVRTLLLVPLRKDAELLGAFVAYRQEVRPFTDKQIALLQNFAAQAVIAMENARLITETREALEQQTATAEVLSVINTSPGDLGPVFDAMLERAMRLCEAAFGGLWTFEGDRYIASALRNVPHAYAGFLAQENSIPGPGTAPYRFLRGERSAVHNLELAAEEPYRAGDPARLALVDLGGARSALQVPLCKDDAVLGVITIYRQEVRPFSDKQIALLQNFASQAVIAIENARLLDEIRQRQAELRVTFDNMADGVAMFDEHLRLAAWNRNFQEMIDLPDVVLSQRPGYADYLRMLAERGEFGAEDIEAELTRRLAETDRELRLERIRPYGRVIEVRRNSVPDGGFVLIYSDITERKRSEAEIRAARDTAEAAYSDLKAAQSSLIQAQKMAALGQLTAGIAHEIKNPLNFVNNFAGLSVELLAELRDTTAPALATLDEDKRADVDETIEMLTGNLEKIVEHGQRADNIVKSMLEHSRGGSGERREVDLNTVIEDALNLAYHGARAQDQSFNIALERDYAPRLTPIELAPQEMTRVFLNLFGNGFYAATKRAQDNGDGSFRPALTVRTREDGDAVEVRVRDNGTGIPPEIRDKLFQPFFTTKPTGEGTGLGLSISYDIITQQHGGTITVESEPGSYTEFTVRLPRH